MIRVLLLDENLGALEMLDFYLSSHGFEVAAARSVGEAALRAWECEPDVVLCDLDRAPLPPDVLCAELAAVPPLAGKPLVAVGGAGDAQTARRFAEWLEKPCALPRVADTLRRAIRRARRAAEAQAIADLVDSADAV